MSADSIVQEYLQAVRRGVRSEIQRHQREMEKEWKAHKDEAVAWLLYAADYKPTGIGTSGPIEPMQS